MKQEEQLAGWQDPTANQQQQGDLPNTEQPKSVRNVGMGQQEIQTAEPQAH